MYDWKFPTLVPPIVLLKNILAESNVHVEADFHSILKKTEHKAIWMV